MNQERPGYFLDVGANDIKHSNTAGLEESGWHGLLVDILRGEKWARRPAEFIVADATCADWAKISEYFRGTPQIDYLSLDVDEATTLALERILPAMPKFRAITIEHDAYRLGRANQKHQHEILTRVGYDLVCCDVCVGPGEWGAGGPFEDWWAFPDLVPKAIRDTWRCFHCDGLKIPLCRASSS